MKKNTKNLIDGIGSLERLQEVLNDLIDQLAGKIEGRELSTTTPDAKTERELSPNGARGKRKSLSFGTRRAHAGQIEPIDPQTLSLIHI